MKARLYRGPHDGRVLEIPDVQRSVTLKRKGRVSIFDKMAVESSPWLTIPTFDDEYTIVLVRQPDGKLGWSVHPDGSVYFEWTKKRGTRIER